MRLARFQAIYESHKSSFFAEKNAKQSLKQKLIQSDTNNNLIEELKLFQKKYSLKIEILSDDRFIIPEYRIDLLNKSKKLIKKFVKTIDY